MRASWHSWYWERHFGRLNGRFTGWPASVLNLEIFQDQIFFTSLHYNRFEFLIRLCLFVFTHYDMCLNFCLIRYVFDFMFNTMYIFIFVYQVMCLTFCLLRCLHALRRLSTFNQVVQWQS